MSKNVRSPPSLVNIFQEIENDLGKDKFKRPNHGCLIGWRDQGQYLISATCRIYLLYLSQGVLLLNDSLTVRTGTPMSHANIGWSEFTNFIISYLSKNIPCLVFMLWGSSAQAKWKKVSSCTSNTNSRHLILSARHPSPLSANQGGWFGNKHFSKANEYLRANDRGEINWGYLP